MCIDLLPERIELHADFNHVPECCVLPSLYTLCVLGICDVGALILVPGILRYILSLEHT